MSFDFPTVNIKIIEELNELYDQINKNTDENKTFKESVISKINELSKNFNKINKKTDIIHELFKRYYSESVENFHNVKKNILNSVEFNELKDYFEHMVCNDNNNQTIKIDSEILNSLVKLKNEYTTIFTENKEMKKKIYVLENRLKALENILETSNI